ncbi:MAG: hypothetical protein H0X43_05510 [Nitrosospira sp.]|nr:hypothetical protein [Nitrosospira sp.]
MTTRIRARNFKARLNSDGTETTETKWKETVLIDSDSRCRYRAMIIAMAVMRVMEMAIDQIIEMVAMRYCFMSAPSSMNMFRGVARAFMPRGTVFRVERRYANHVFIYVTVVRMMQMAIVQVVDMTIVLYAGMATVRAMWMSMIFVLGQGTISHSCSS